MEAGAVCQSEAHHVPRWSTVSPCRASSDLLSIVRSNCDVLRRESRPAEPEFSQLNLPLVPRWSTASPCRTAVTC